MCSWQPRKVKAILKKKRKKITLCYSRGKLPANLLSFQRKMLIQKFLTYSCGFCFKCSLKLCIGLTPIRNYVALCNYVLTPTTRITNGGEENQKE